MKSAPGRLIWRKKMLWSCSAWRGGKWKWNGIRPGWNEVGQNPISPCLTWSTVCTSFWGSRRDMERLTTGLCVHRPGSWFLSMYSAIQSSEHGSETFASERRWDYFTTTVGLLNLYQSTKQACSPGLHFIDSGKKPRASAKNSEELKVVGFILTQWGIKPSTVSPVLSQTAFLTSIHSDHIS